MNMQQDLTTLSVAHLIGIHNGLNPDAPLSVWKKKKTLLMEQINILRKAAEVIECNPVNSRERTIRAASIELLCNVAYHENCDEKPDDYDNRVAESDKNARSVGLAYDEIIRRIQAEFPDCKTTVACLRWYSVKIRVEEQGYEGLRLPQRRPRVRPAKKT